MGDNCAMRSSLSRQISDTDASCRRLGQTVPGLGPSIRLSPDRHVIKRGELKLFLFTQLMQDEADFVVRNTGYQTGIVGMVFPMNVQ
ncbi:Uncharacterised protein [Salmonella enterica subsp. enterica serovar Madelia]|nr:Uncharacterised protein [Salmonella enterica subsp. enterica serovar Madelia]